MENKLEKTAQETEQETATKTVTEIIKNIVMTDQKTVPFDAIFGSSPMSLYGKCLNSEETNAVKFTIKKQIEEQKDAYGNFYLSVNKIDILDANSSSGAVRYSIDVSFYGKKIEINI